MSSEIIINDLSEIITKLKNECDSKQLTIERLEKEAVNLKQKNKILMNRWVNGGEERT